MVADGNERHRLQADLENGWITTRMKKVICFFFLLYFLPRKRLTSFHQDEARLLWERPEYEGESKIPLLSLLTRLNKF